MMPGRMTGSVMVCFRLGALVTYKYEAHDMVSEARYGLSKQSFVHAVERFLYQTAIMKRCYNIISSVC